jgi:multicomponent Na+:H+ antiporter subunit G
MIEIAIDILSWAALLGGSAFYIIGAVGLYRMPDVFTRMHATSVGDTLGAGLLLVGMLLQAGPTLVGAKLVLIMLALLFTGSVATHALARAALQDGVKPVVASKSGRLIERDAAEAMRPLEDLVSATGKSAGKSREGSSSKR